MNQDDFKKILEDSLKPIREEQAEFKKSVDKSFVSIREEQAEFRRIIEDRVLPPLAYIEATLKSYADRYVDNQDHIRRLDKRLHTVEEEMGIHPPQELSIPVLD